AQIAASCFLRRQLIQCSQGSVEWPPGGLGIEQWWSWDRTMIDVIGSTGGRLVVSRLSSNATEEDRGAYLFKSTDGNCCAHHRSGARATASESRLIRPAVKRRRTS